MTLFGDAYVNIGRNGLIRRSDPPEGPRPLLFVDVAGGALLRDLRDVPHTYLENVRTVVVRDDNSTLPRAARLLEALGCKAATALLVQEMGRPTSLKCTPSANLDVEWIVRRARAVELKTRLDLGAGIWASKRYHFLLPSGRHADGFVRFANAVQEPDDAKGIARWLLPYVKTGSHLVADSATLSPILLALDLEMRRFKAAAGPMIVLDRYPRTKADVCTALASTLTTAPCLIVLSVNSSGSTRDFLDSALRMLGIAPATIVTLVDTQGLPCSPPDNQDKVTACTFLALDGQSGGMTIRSWDKDCALCRTPERAALVPVDSRTFDAYFPLYFQSVMPSVPDARNNRILWEICNKASVISLEALPDVHVNRWRPSKLPLPIKFDLAKLINAESFAVRCAQQLTQAADTWRPKAQGKMEPWPSFDLVLVPSSDTKRSGFEAFWKVAGKRFNLGKRPVSVPNEGMWPASTVKKVEAANNILLFSLGTVTGATLQHMLVTIQDRRKDNNYDLYAAIGHARPAHARTWTTLRNSFAGRLIYGWLSYLPDESPLREEALGQKFTEGITVHVEWAMKVRHVRPQMTAVLIREDFALPPVEFLCGR